MSNNEKDLVAPDNLDFKTAKKIIEGERQHRMILESCREAERTTIEQARRIIQQENEKDLVAPDNLDFKTAKKIIEGERQHRMILESCREAERTTIEQARRIIQQENEYDYESPEYQFSVSKDGDLYFFKEENNQTPSIAVIRVSSNDDRDAWLYKLATDGIDWKTILNSLKKQQPKWGQIESVAGIRRAVARYADRKRLPPVNPRKNGRKRQ